MRRVLRRGLRGAAVAADAAWSALTGAGPPASAAAGDEPFAPLAEPSGAGASAAPAVCAAAALAVERFVLRRPLDFRLAGRFFSAAAVFPAAWVVSADADVCVAGWAVSAGCFGPAAAGSAPVSGRASGAG